MCAASPPAGCPIVRATILLADSAQVDPAGKVHALGMGWSVTTAPTPPIALILLFQVPWTDTNRPVLFRVRLLDGDGQPAVVGADPQGSPLHLQVDGSTEVGRPAGLPAGSAVVKNVVVPLRPGFELAPGVTYEFRLEIDGAEHEDWRAPFLVRRT